jgi:glyceraldehyde-3-phosphate dehydrogenase/erythrose-4-phosphate dehydrogenase
MSEANVKRALGASGRRHNEWGFSNRMLDTTMALMAAR